MTIHANSTKPLWILWLTAWTMLAWVTSPCHSDTAGSIRLHDQAATHDDQVQLSEVAELEGEVAQVLQHIVLAQLDPGHRQITLTLDQVRQGLDKHGVNWGKISLRGYATCQVVRPATGRAEPLTGQVAPIVTNPIEEIGLATALTLRDRLIEVIEQFAGVQQNDLRITFAPDDDRILTQSAWKDRYEFQPLSSTPLGRVPVVIRQYHDDQLANTYRVTADVARRYMAVVARHAVGRGQTFAPGDVEIREIYLDDIADRPLTDLSQVIGRVSASIVRAGAVVRRQQLRSPVLVQRGELMTVRCITGDLVVKTVGRAAEDGELDQLIQVRNDRSRQTYTVRVTGRQEGITMTTSDTERIASDTVASAEDRP